MNSPACRRSQAAPDRRTCRAGQPDYHTCRAGQPGRSRWWALLPALVPLVGLPGCGVWQSLSVRDDEVASAALRVAVRPQAWARSEKPGPGFEFGFERVRAEDVRTLAAGEAITVNTQVINGPDRLGQRATVQVAHVAYTHPFHFGGHFELEPFGGLANVKVRYRAEPASSPLRPELATSRTALIGGITPRLRLNEWAAVEARFSIIPLSDSDVYGRSAEIAAVLTPIPQLALRVGYAQRRHGADFNIDSAWTQLDVRSSGPFAALQFEF